MSWHFSQALVEEYLGENSLDGELSVPSNGTPTHGMFWSPDKTTAASTRSRSGMTFRPSTGSHGADLLTWYLADSHARTSPPPEKAPGSPDPDPASGNTWRESSARYCPHTSTWRTHRCLWDEALPPSSPTLPRWGMMLDGVLLERVTPGLPTRGSGFGLREATYPTPNTLDAAGAGRMNPNANVKKWGGVNSLGGMAATGMWPTPKAHEPGMTAKTTGRGVEKSTHLTTQVALAEGMIDRKTGRLWPTPQAHKTTESGEIVNADGTPWDGKSKPHSKTTGRPITTALADAVKFATPQARDFRTSQQSRWENPERTRNLNDQIGGQLNPTWVEWLMGWPLGWTDCAASATAKFRQWLDSHGRR